MREVRFKGSFTLKIASSISEFRAGQWNGLTDETTIPFLEWEWLSALEESGSAAPKTGWHPLHLSLWKKDALLAAAPLYLKNHSEGEFVWDYMWAKAAAEMGRAWYPKLVGTVPATPAEGYRFLTARDEDAALLNSTLLDAAESLCRTNGIGGLHFLFTDPKWAAAVFSGRGYHAWEHQRYVWENAAPPEIAASCKDESGEAASAGTGAPPDTAASPEKAAPPEKAVPANTAALAEGRAPFSGFDDFLACLNKNQRKNIRKEYKRHEEQNIHLRIVENPEEPFFEKIFELYTITNDKFIPWDARWVNGDFFRRLARTFSHRIVFSEASRAAEEGGEETLALAMMIRKHGTIWGRYWGAYEDIRDLHFAACYYAPMDYCIREGIRYFDPGAGSPHKLKRGFRAVFDSSCHKLFDPVLNRLFKDNIDEVNRYERENIAAMNGELPFRKGPEG